MVLLILFLLFSRKKSGLAEISGNIKGKEYLTT